MALRSEFEAFYSPFCRFPYDRIFPLTSLFLLLLLPPFSTGGADTCHRSPSCDLSRFNFNRTIVESWHTSPILDLLLLLLLLLLHETVYFYSRAIRSPIFAPLEYSWLLLFSATSSPSSPVFVPTFKLYLNRHPVIYIIDFRNAPVGIHNDFIFKRGKPG